MLLQHCPPKAEECGLPYCALHPPPRSQLAPLLRTGRAFVSRRCEFLLSFKCTMQDPMPRCIQNESPGKGDGQPQELRIHSILSRLSAPCAPYTHKPSSQSRRKTRNGFSKTRLNQRCYMRLASSIQILIQEICNKSTHALIKNSSYPIIFIVTYISVYYWCLRKKIKRRLYLWR